MMFSLLYIWRIQANPHQVYAMRRYVPVVVPFAVIAAAALLAEIMQNRRLWARAAGAGLALAWLGGMVWSAQGFVRQVDYQGFTDQLEAFEARLEAGSILLFNDQSAITAGDILGTPLRFLYGHQVLSLRDPTAMQPGSLRESVVAWQDQGLKVYWVGEPPPVELELATSAPFTAEIESSHLEGRYDRKPAAIVPANWTLVVTPLD
jgi:hypothetical protein